jgi:glycosyltransferase involved in cell wall biosynthesis
VTEPPAVSVLIPCWNAEASIGRAIASVLSEHGVDLECIVVDDASTDGTLEVVRGIAAADPRVVVLALEANGGVSNARNRGQELARGEWLTLLDADDRFRPGGIAALHRAAVARDALAVVGQQVWSDGRRTWIGPLYDIPDIRTPGRKSLASAPGLLYYVSAHGKLFHRSLVEGLRFEGRVLGDQPWVIRALLRAGDRIEVLGETVYDWIRVASPGAGPSITAATRATAQRGVEAAEVAGQALAAVLAEIELEVEDGSEASRLARTYIERLLRSDLGVHLARAIDRADPGMADLFTAIGAFLAPLPAALWPRRAVLHEIIEPPLRRWSRVPVEARPAFEALVADVLTRQRLLAEAGRNPVDRWALRRLLSESDGRDDRLAFAALALTSAVRGMRAAPRRARAFARRLPLARAG